MTSSYAAAANPFDHAFGGDTPPAPARPEPFAFTGTGSEYFRIWIVNLLLTILTLGIYSAWAKVRRERYFYDNTRLAGSSFEYHGNPVAILKGRIVAVLLFGGYNLAFEYSATAGFVMFGLFLLAFPWLMWKSLQFKLQNSSYRGIRFGFRGGAAGAYVAYLFYPALAVLSLYTLAPLAHQRIKRFQHTESRYGSTHFSFDAGVGGFYVVYLIGFGVMLAGLVALGLLFGGTLAALYAAGGKGGLPAAFTMTMMFFAIYAWVFLLIPIMMTLMQNLIWRHTRLGEHAFKCEMKWTRVAYIAVTNIAGILLTLGLFIPFAKVRMMRYRLESMTLLPHGDLDHFIAEAQRETTAAGEGMADLLDFDMSL
ncbi:MAG TPA: YjgN family protein [Paucimonas sp.]|nr:YjgN family protein [Paucimonas sp.]